MNLTVSLKRMGERHEMQELEMKRKRVAVISSATAMTSLHFAEGCLHIDRSIV
jgi:hypothetical protein